MENKKNNWLFAVVFIVIGMFAGWMIWGVSLYRINQTEYHIMPNGIMMSNNGAGTASMMNDMMGGLYGKTGDNFDKAFLGEMIIHHQGAVLMAQEALKNAKHQEIKNMANAIISTQTIEINQMKGWLRSWYNQ